jgi:TolB-like protein/Tfp pilus assembly protein PilF
MTRQGGTVYEFGPFQIGKDERLLRRGSDVVPLPPKAADLLLTLLERTGEAVRKDELLNAVWPGTFVEEGSLAQNVSLLRKALGDGPESRYIETVPKRGYRFVAAVRSIRDGHGARRSLAVLPLVNLSGDRAQDFFAEGMTDELIGRLMRLPALRVASRTSVMTYSGTLKPLRQIASELNVDWIVEGAVLQAAGRVRITAHLIEAASETQLWAEEYEKDARDVLSLQSNVAGEIARQVGGTMPPSEQSGISKVRSVDPDAYDAYLRGRYFLNKRTRHDLNRATGYFQTAIDRDPTYAPPHAGLADAYALLGTIGYDVLPPREAMPRARAASLRALDIDGTMAEAHTSLGYVRLSYDWDWAGAEEGFRRAISYNGAYAAAHLWYGHCMFAVQRVEDGARAMHRALELDPLSVPCNLGVGWSLYYARRYDEAIAQFRRTLELAPAVPMVLYELGLSYQKIGRYDEAFAAFHRGHDLSGGEAASVMLLAHLHALTGQDVEAIRGLVRLEELSRGEYVPALYTAFVHAGRGDRDQAFAWFDRALEERSTYLIYLAVEPALDVLRPDPRYGDLLRQIGLR